jgi:uncharacterized protein (DUF2141 family)
MALPAQNKLSIKVEGVKSSDGEIMVAIYKEAHGFLKLEKMYKGESTKANKGVTHVAIHDLPDGTYAAALFHDQNGNHNLDTNWMGIPKEDIGFSMAKMKTFGPPSFQECSFQLSGDRILTIPL